MRTVGIIAEYNPLHTGHEYHIKEAKKYADADYAVVVMSPDFVQRGEPAIFDKYTRAKMALLAGADLVIELPVCYATGSAEYFAQGSVRMLDELGVIDSLCFGAETNGSEKSPEIDLFQQIAELLLDEPKIYQQELRRGLETGLTFPQARAKAFSQIQMEKSLSQISATDLLSSPNNILGVEYCKALQIFHSSIHPIAIKREGNAYSSLNAEGEYCSAMAIREALRKSPGVTTGLEPYIPVNLRHLFTDACQTPVFPDDLLPFLTEKLIYRECFDDILDISPDLSRRIKAMRYACIGKRFDEIICLLKTKQMTHVRICRALLHLILDIRKDALEAYLRDGILFYAHVLGFRREAAPLLHEIKKRSALPLITKASRASKILSETGLMMWEQDVAASHLYRSLTASRYGIPFRMEYEISPIVR